MTVTTRIMYALARDNALPKSSWLKVLHSETKNPDRILYVTLALDCLLLSLVLISTTAFTAISSVSTIGYQISYAIPIGLRLISARDRFVLNDEFNLGRVSHAVGWVAFVWLICTSMMLFFPQKIDPRLGVTYENFNYTFVVVFSALLIAAIYWALPRPYGARYFFRGPVRVEDNEELAIQKRQSMKRLRESFK